MTTSERTTKTPTAPKPADRRQADAELDEALSGTFPASDPVSVESPTHAGDSHDTSDTKKGGKR